VRGFVLNPTHRVVDGRPEVHLYGVLEDGSPCLLIDDRFRPYFFIRASDLTRARAVAPTVEAEETNLASFAAEPVVRVVVRLPDDLPPLRSRLERSGIPCFEADIRFAYRYLIDHGIRGAFEVHGHADRHQRLGRVLRNPELTPVHWQPALRVLSIDIETDPHAKSVYAIALHAREFERVLIVHDHALEKGEPVHSEKELIRRFLAYVEELDPDVITGWNVVDFDLTVLARVAHNHGIRCTLGRNQEELRIRKDASFSRESRAVLYGRQVLDGLALMRGAFYKLDDYKLETAAQAILGRGKLIAGADRAAEIEKAFSDDPQHLVDYNLQDARLVSDILDATGLVDLAIERSLLTGMQLDRVGAAIASIDSLYLPELRRRGRVAPSVHVAAEPEAISGGYVMSSKPGLYRNVLVFDFKSLYPSIIRTFNLDPLSRAGEADPPDMVLATPNGARFLRSPRGILPDLLDHLSSEREEARNAGRVVKANAIKILMNSFYGVLGAPTSRLFAPEVANAITTLGQRIIQWAARDAQKAGYEVIYGDTDSLFVHAPEGDTEDTLALAERLRGLIGAAVERRIRKEYGRESFLELEFEKLYHRFFLPELRSGKGGSKKRYAGLLRDGDGEHIEFVGLEAVRRDWTEVSKRFQRELMQRVFHGEPVEEFVAAFVVDLKAGRWDDELVYKKAVRKDLRDYTKTTPPHVKAARKLGDSAGRIIAYVMTKNGPEPLEAMTAAPNYEHYIDHQIAPVADAVLHMLGKSFEAIVPRKGQMSLF
jgi:DNA polymerase-2